MAEPQKLNLALFGQTGSGKTAFFASYYGTQQRRGFRKEHGYSLAVRPLSVGNSLLGRYHRLEEGRFPDGTLTARTYTFDLIVEGLDEPAMTVTWLDYPGGWWDGANGPEEEEDRQQRLTELLEAHAVVLLVDGEKYVADRGVYLKVLFGQFRNALYEIKKEIKSQGKDSGMLPQTVILALSKADVLPEGETAETFVKTVFREAGDEAEDVAETLGGGPKTPAPFVRDVLLLSSVGKDDAGNFTPDGAIGLSLIAPVALMAILENVAEKAGEGKTAGWLGSALEYVSGLVGFVDKLDDKLPPKFQMITKILQRLPLEDLATRGADYFHKQQAQAVERRDALAAAVATIQGELTSLAAARAYYRVQK